MTRNKKVVYLEKEQLLKKKSCPKCVHQTAGLSTKADGRTELRGDLIAGHCSPPLSDRAPQTARAWSPMTHRSLCWNDTHRYCSLNSRTPRFSTSQRLATKMEHTCHKRALNNFKKSKPYEVSFLTMVELTGNEEQRTGESPNTCRRTHSE